jgi:hypothetical protein
VPVTVELHVAVWGVVIEAGEQVTETDVIVDAAVTFTFAEPDLVVSWVEIAVIVAVPEPEGEKTPELLIPPMLDGLTVQVTVEL